jgi:hypothetical protein
MACSGSGAGKKVIVIDNSGSGGSNSSAGGVTGSSGTGVGAGPQLGTGGAPMMDGGGGAGNACATASATPMITTEPVDIIVIVDNSGSMDDEIKQVESNLNVNFANVLTTSQVDYRVILISRYRTGTIATSICVDPPLSGAPAGFCEMSSRTPDVPMFTDRFYQYSVKINSTDSLTNIIQAYNTADSKKWAPMGWGPWLRLGAKKVFLEFTDDSDASFNADAAMDVDTFFQQLTMLAPEHFGTDPANPTLTYHTIIGLKEKADPAAPYLASEPVQPDECTGNGDSVTNNGPTWQEISIRTGGLRFPICQYTHFDTVFQTIAQDVVSKAEIACDFALPDPPVGQVLDLSKVAVSYTPLASTDAHQFGQVLDPADCQADAFYISNGRIYLCDDACTTVKTNESSVNVLFTCDSTIIPK